MTIKTLNINEIPPSRICVDKKIKKKIIVETIDSFKRSSAICIEVIDDEGLWANSNNFRRSFQSYLERYHHDSILVTIRGNRVFLIKRYLR